MQARFYTQADRAAWNAHNLVARNGHFIFDRHFMEYHADRFRDASIMITEGDDLLAVLPANILGDTAYSHQGLTFGGLLLAGRATTTRVIAVMKEVSRLLETIGIQRLVYKAIPSIYHVRPAEEDLYALTRLGGVIIRRDVTTAINLQSRGPVSTRRIRGLKKAKAHGLHVGRSQRWGDYWRVLAETLESRHDVNPTHSEMELIQLASQFPGNIKLFTAEKNGDVLAGVVIFETSTVAHAQYLASNTVGRDFAALDLASEYAIDFYRSDKRFFDFGISTVDQGKTLNEGLIKQKEEFGGSSIVHDIYELHIQQALRR